MTRLSDSQETISNARVHGFGWESDSPQSYLEVEVRLAKLAVENGLDFEGSGTGKESSPVVLPSMAASGNAEGESCAGAPS